jgi:hypothetical protein
VLNIASTLPVAVVPFVAPALLAARGFLAMFACLAVLSMAGAVSVLRVPGIGQEGQPRFAAMHRDSRRRGMSGGPRTNDQARRCGPGCETHDLSRFSQ